LQRPRLPSSLPTANDEHSQSGKAAAKSSFPPRRRRIEDRGVEARFPIALTEIERRIEIKIDRRIRSVCKATSAIMSVLTRAGPGTASSTQHDAVRLANKRSRISRPAGRRATPPSKTKH